MKKTITLQEATAFPDLNRAESKEANFERTELAINSLKYKNFRSVMQYPEQDQMHHLMMALTGLSENDIGELTPHDAAQLSGIVFDAMKEYMELGRRVAKNLSDKG